MNIHLSCKAVVALEILVISIAAFSLLQSSSFVWFLLHCCHVPLITSGSL